MIACWSPKGGSGTTVVATVLALELGRRSSNAVLIDSTADCATVLGNHLDADLPGLHQWLQSSTSVPLEASSRLLVEVTPQLRLLPQGQLSARDLPIDGQARRLSESLSTTDAVVDAGQIDNASEIGRSLVSASSTSLMVLRPCYLAVKRASKLAIKLDGFVLVEEPGRSLDVRDIEDVLGVAARAVVPWDAAVARLVDAGRMKSRLPRSQRSLRGLAESLAQDTAVRRAG